MGEKPRDNSNRDLRRRLLKRVRQMLRGMFPLLPAEPQQEPPQGVPPQPPSAPDEIPTSMPPQVEPAAVPHQPVGSPVHELSSAQAAEDNRTPTLPPPPPRKVVSVPRRVPPKQPPSPTSLSYERNPHSPAFAQEKAIARNNVNKKKEREFERQKEFKKDFLKRGERYAHSPRHEPEIEKRFEEMLSSVRNECPFPPLCGNITTREYSRLGNPKFIDNDPMKPNMVRVIQWEVKTYRISSSNSTAMAEEFQREVLIGLVYKLIQFMPLFFSIYSNIDRRAQYDCFDLKVKDANDFGFTITFPPAEGSQDTK